MEARESGPRGSVHCVNVHWQYTIGSLERHVSKVLNSDRAEQALPRWSLTLLFSFLKLFTQLPHLAPYLNRLRCPLVHPESFHGPEGDGDGGLEGGALHILD